MLKYTNFLTFKELYEKSVSLNIAAKAFVAWDFLKISLWSWGFWGSLSYKNFSYRKKRVVLENVFLWFFLFPPMNMVLIRRH